MDQTGRRIRTVIKIDSPLYTGREAAEYLRIGKSTLYALAKQGEIPYRMVGRSMRFVRAELDEKFCGIKN